MAHVTYKIVRHEDGWAYTASGVFSESFPTHAGALDAARRAARNSAFPDGPKPSSTRMPRANGTSSSRPAATVPIPTSRIRGSQYLVGLPVVHHQPSCLGMNHARSIEHAMAGAIGVHEMAGHIDQEHAGADAVERVGEGSLCLGLTEDQSLCQ